MSILARHRVLSVRDLWPDETEPVDFVAHALRLLIGDPQLADERAIVQEMIREAARPQVRQHLHWLDVPPEELAAYLILRRFVADVEFQNPSNQLSGLQIFSPETSLLDLEPLALGVAAALSADAPGLGCGEYPGRDLPHAPTAPESHESASQRRPAA